jgi:patatin-like phospholipase/acyl hydrolase
MSKSQPEGKPVRRVLSIDGGGIRGIIPAMVVASIEKKMGKPAQALFDLMVGTSTGGILALGLSRPGFRAVRLNFQLEEWLSYTKSKALKYLNIHCGESYVR